MQCCSWRRRRKRCSSQKPRCCSLRRFLSSALESGSGCLEPPCRGSAGTASQQLLFHYPHRSTQQSGFWRRGRRQRTKSLRGAGSRPKKRGKRRKVSEGSLQNYCGIPVGPSSCTRRHELKSPGNRAPADAVCQHFLKHQSEQPKRWEQRCPSKDEWINKVMCISHTQTHTWKIIQPQEA